MSRNVSDVLTVTFDKVESNVTENESAICVSRKHGDKTVVLKMEVNEQADILYRLLTDQMTKAEIKEDK